MMRSMLRSGVVLCTVAVICWAVLETADVSPAAAAQQPQNPSPIVEHTRAHPRREKKILPGRRERLELGTLFVPQTLESKLRRKQPVPLLVFFHGGEWLPEVAAAETDSAVITIQLGAGSGTYSRAFTDAERFSALLREAERKAGVSFAPLTVGGWSAGCGAIRELIKQPESYARISRVLAIDGIHTGYVGGAPGPLESQLETANLQPWLTLARDAVAGRRKLLITHGEIFPGTFASTTETADWLLRELGLRRRAVLKWGPMGMQLLSETRSGGLLVLGFAGNAAPDHVDHLHALPEFLKMFR